MTIVLGVILLIILVIVVDAIRYKMEQNDRIKGCEDTQRYITHTRNGWDNGTLYNKPNNGTK